MRLSILSYKVCWYSKEEADYVTYGGFPFQMGALSALFDSTNILMLERNTPIPVGSVKIVGKNIKINTLPEPKGRDFLRKIALLLWFPRYFSTIWEAVRESDAVHTPIPGDLGTLGMLLALLQRKPLFIRHCGRWGIPSSRFDRYLQQFLEKIAGGKNVVMATGGSPVPPSTKNPAISWIFSSALNAEEIFQLPSAKPWQPGEILRIITVGSLLPGKNITALIKALPMIRERIPSLTLDVVGTGRLLEDLHAQVLTLGLGEIVRFCGNLSHEEVLAIISKSHLFVFPTLYEGFPKALLEAMACGLPIIANPVSVIPQLLGNGAGVLLEKTDPSVIAAKVLDLTGDPVRMAEMGKEARKRAGEYTLERWRDLIGTRLELAWGQPLIDDIESSQGIVK